MKKRNIIFTLLFAIVFFFSSCEMKSPVPVVGNYSVRENKEESQALFFLSLKDDNTFILYQAGGENRDYGVTFTGRWKMNLKAFNFLKADGSFSFYDVVADVDDIGGMVLTPGVENRYTFYWTKDKNTADATLSLASENNRICQDIAIGFAISQEEMDEQLEKVGAIK